VGSPKDDGTSRRRRAAVAVASPPLLPVLLPVLLLLLLLARMPALLSALSPAMLPGPQLVPAIMLVVALHPRLGPGPSLGLPPTLLFRRSHCLVVRPPARCPLLMVMNHWLAITGWRWSCRPWNGWAAGAPGNHAAGQAHQGHHLLMW
jgi:hypothetical protein